MRKMTLIKLVLRNFKGIREFILEENGGNAKVYGDNATGKTSLFDAFIWLLFNKDSQNNGEPHKWIKTLDENNDVLHGLDHEVEGYFDIGGKIVVLRKVFSEVWTKKRGSAESQHTGHTTDYFIDGVPLSKGEYDKYIKDLVDEEVFKLLTSPSYFNEQLHRTERRNALLDICGDITDQEVIDSNKALAKLSSILGDRDIESHRKVIAAKRTDINKEIEKIPTRIDEVQRGIPELPSANKDSIEHAIATKREAITVEESKITTIRSGGEITTKQNRIKEIEGELLQLKNDLQADTLQKISEQQIKVSKMNTKAEVLNSDIQRKERQITSNSREITLRQERAVELRTYWKDVNETELEIEHQQDNCSACGQSLPEHEVQAAYEKAVADANLKKSKRLESLSNEGKAVVAEATELEQKNEELSAEINTLNEQMVNKLEDLNIEKSELERLRGSVQDVATDSTYIEKKAEIVTIQDEIKQLRESAQTSVDKVQGVINSLRHEISELEIDLAKFAQVEASNKRIKDLKLQERKLADEYGKLEEELYLTEEFIRTKVQLLESKINSKFKYARFKLFNQQVNGGLEEVCETLYKGVPYSSGLNNAARINVGLDIINTLSEHYKFSAPIFVDNAEAVTQLIDVDSQVIKLIVPPTFGSLPEETRAELIKIHGSYEDAVTVWKDSNKQLRVEANTLQEVI